MTKEIPLKDGRQGYSLVSDEDFERANQYRWYVGSHGYAVHKIHAPTAENRKAQIVVLLHRFILDAPTGTDVDHRNGNKLDNQRSNIRLCTRSQNLTNKPSIANTSSKFKGVSWSQRDQKWRATITAYGKHMYLGCSFDEEEAARMYDEAALAIWGSEFVQINFPQHRNSYLLALTIQRASSSVRWFSPSN